MLGNKESEPVVYLENMMSSFDFIKLMNDNIMMKKVLFGQVMAKKHLPDNFLLLHEQLTTILRENTKIIKKINQDEICPQIKMLNATMRSILNQQNQLINQNQANREEIKKIILEMRSEVFGDFQDRFSQKINKTVEQYSPQTLLLKINSKIEELENTNNVNHSQCTYQLKEFKATRITSVRISIIQPEEVKQSETYFANKILTDQHGYFDEAYSFLRDIDSFNVEPELIVVRLEMGILQNKIPDGPAFIQYKDPPNLSFHGISRFNQGKQLNNGCTYIGGLEHQIKIEGNKQELQADSNHTVYFFKYQAGKKIEELITQGQEIYRSLERMETEHICQLQPQLDNLYEENSQANKSFYELEKTIQETTGSLNRDEQEPKGQTETYCSDSFSRQSQQHLRNIDYTNKIIELTYDEENEIQEYLFLNQNIEQIIKLKCNSSSEAYYIHSGVLKYALDNNDLYFFKDIFSQNVIQNEDLTIIEKLKLLSSNQSLSQKDIKFLCKTKQSMLYRVGENTAKQALIKDEYSLNQKIKMLLNNVYQAQMQAIMGRQKNLEVRQYFQIDEKMKLVDFIWSIPTLLLLRDQKDFTEEKVLEIFSQTIKHIGNYHCNNLFHGDIKPANIFFDKDFNIMTTDVGSLIYLGNPDNEKQETHKFIVSCYTEKYASPEYIEAVRNKVPLTREQLMKEDKHQLKLTLIEFLNNQNKFTPSEEWNQTLRYFDDESFPTVSQIYKKIECSLSFLLKNQKNRSEKVQNEEIQGQKIQINQLNPNQLLALYCYHEKEMMRFKLYVERWFKFQDEFENSLLIKDQNEKEIISLKKLIMMLEKQSILTKEGNVFRIKFFFKMKNYQLKIEISQNKKNFKLNFYLEQDPQVNPNHRKKKYLMIAQF